MITKENILLFITGFSLLLLCNFNKVEESFNTQAIHDILYHKFNTSKYDHKQFPGVVPRTFTIPLLISFLAYPIVNLNDLYINNLLFSYIIARFVILILATISHAMFLKTIKKQYSFDTAFLYSIITSIQFHVNFYSSRTLPNTFAFILTTSSLAFYFNRKYKAYIIVAGFTILVVRSELCIFHGLFLLRLLILKKMGILKVLKICIITTIFVLGITIPIDSYFWGRLCWPEGEVFWYNTILNKSSNWGVLPFWWYFTSALPRLLLGCGILSIGYLIFGSKKPELTHSVFISLLFVAIYSLLPHKELRFIIYVVPIFNLAAAQFMADVIYKKDFWNLPQFMLRLLQWFCVPMLLITLGMTIVSTIVSSYNYPGGDVIKRLNNMQLANDKVPSPHIYICNLAAQTGFSRFLEQHPTWRYNKTEYIEDKPDFMNNFDFIVLESKHKQRFLDMMLNWSNYSLDYRILFEQFAFSKIQLNTPFIQLYSALVVIGKHN